MTRRLAVLGVTTCLLFAMGPLAWGFTCPVVIQQAADLIRKAEGKTSAETKPFVDEAKKLLAEARAHHENAKSKRDHADAVRKAKVASALAEEAIVLQAP